MSNAKIKQLLNQKEKLETQLKEEMGKRLTQIGKLAKKSDVLHWSNDALHKVFEMAKEKGEDFYHKATKEKLKDTKKDSDQ